MNNDCRICLSSPPDRDKLVAEIFFGRHQWGELNQEGPELVVEIYPRSDRKPWSVSYEQIIYALEKAKKELVG